LANRALIPIQAITRTAQQISERDLSQRITRNLSDDELGQLARTFNTMLDRVEGAFQRQQRFTADAAHELRTPLSIMQTGIDVMLSQERSTTEYRATLETIREEVQRLTTLTVNLLTLARADAHTLMLNRHSMDLSILVHTVLDQIAPLAEQKNVTIQRSIVPQLSLSADEDRLIQMTLNLIGNAVKYTPEGGSVTVTVSREGSKAQLVITDTGAGISPEHLPHIFDRFYRMDRSRKRDQGGFGLGLAIARQIAQLHGGEITVSSQVGVGSQFMVILPTS
jgi:heavy metal sensor kinase